MLQPRLKRIVFHDNGAVPESQSEYISMQHLQPIPISINISALLRRLHHSFCKRLRGLGFRFRESDELANH